MTTVSDNVPVHEALMEVFPWMEPLPLAERLRFSHELVRAVQASAQLLVEWEATAAIFADPKLVEQMRGPVDGDLGEVLAAGNPYGAGPKGETAVTSTMHDEPGTVRGDAEAGSWVLRTNALNHPGAWVAVGYAFEGDVVSHRVMMLLDLPVIGVVAGSPAAGEATRRGAAR